MVKVHDGLIFAGALSLWMADRVVEQTMTSRGRIRLAVGTGCALLGLTGLLYITTGHMWASNLTTQQRASRHQAGASILDTPAMLGMIDDAKSGIRHQRQKLQQVRQQSEAIALLSSSVEDHVPTGRQDPFEPLIKAPVLNPSGLPAPSLFKPKPIDPMGSLSFAGTIGDANSASAVGIFKLNDPQRGTITEIKRIGESVELPNGQQAELRSVGRSSAELLLNGQLRTVSLLSYDDSDSASASPKTAPVMTAQPSPPKKPIIHLEGFKE